MFRRLHTLILVSLKAFESPLEFEVKLCFLTRSSCKVVWVWSEAMQIPPAQKSRNTLQSFPHLSHRVTCVLGKQFKKDKCSHFLLILKEAFVFRVCHTCRGFFSELSVERSEDNVSALVWARWRQSVSGWLIVEVAGLDRSGRRRRRKGKGVG